MGQMLLREFNELDYRQDDIPKIRERNKGKIVLKGILQKADTLNQNGRIYPRPILEREVENYQKFIRERRALGEADHPSESVVSLQNVSHLVTEAVMDRDGVVHGAIELLDTPKGLIIQKLVEAGIKLGISSRGVGSTRDQGGNQIVQDDFVLIAWDMVADPSTPQAFMMKEAKMADLVALREKHLTKSDRIDRIVTDILGWEKR